MEEYSRKKGEKKGKRVKKVEKRERDKKEKGKRKVKKRGKTILKEEETKNITKFPPNAYGEEKSDMLEKCHIFSSFLI